MVIGLEDLRESEQPFRPHHRACEDAYRLRGFAGKLLNRIGRTTGPARIVIDWRICSGKLDSPLVRTILEPRREGAR